jgi:gentisate 1,2-dioxygenase
MSPIDNTSDRRTPRQHLGMPAATRDDNLLEWLFELRDRQRAKLEGAAWLIKGKDLPLERNRQGQMRWFLHPALEDIALRSMLFVQQEIPPGGRSGVQRVPGGSVLYIISGHGHTVLDGERYDWAAEDVVNLPIRIGGIVIQHVNDDPLQPVVFIQADVNTVDSLGVDRGATFEQIEPAPDYAVGQTNAEQR